MLLLHVLKHALDVYGNELCKYRCRITNARYVLNFNETNPPNSLSFQL